MKMKRDMSIQRPQNSMARHRTGARRLRGTTLIEVLVSFGLLASLGSILIPTIVRHGRLRQTLRHERLAMDELSNQLDVLSTVPADDLESAVSQVAPSELIQARLRDVRMTVTTIAIDDEGTRITLRIAWDSPGRRNNPLQLTAWRYPADGAIVAGEREPVIDTDPAEDSGVSGSNRDTEDRTR